MVEMGGFTTTLVAHAGCMIVYAQRVRSRISFAQAQAPLCARIRSDVVHRRCFFLAAASKKGLAWLEFEGKARTHNKYCTVQYKCNAIQERVLLGGIWNWKREEKRNGLSGSQLEVQQLGSGRMFWGSVNGQKADVDGLWMACGCAFVIQISARR